MSTPPLIPPKPSELHDDPLPVPPTAPRAPPSALPVPAAAATAGPPRPVNRYTRRLAGTPKACFVCHRPSPVVLVSVSLPNEDFFYTCATHLSDRHFATRVETPVATTAAAPSTASPPPPKVSPEEIEKVKREYESKKTAKAQQHDQGQPGDDKDKKDSKSSSSWFGSAVGSLASTVVSIAVPSSVDTPPPAEKATSSQSATSSPTGTHERYSLDRSYFAMRTELIKKRDAARQMRALNMPSAPSRAVGP